jgi:hypothetical protein
VPYFLKQLPFPEQLFVALIHESLEVWHKAGTLRIGLVEFAEELEALNWLDEEGGDATRAVG